MPKVLIIIGSVSDEAIMQESIRYLQYFNIQSTLEIASAHRNPDRVDALASSAADNAYSCIIAGAGMAAALPGVLAAKTNLPVIGVPLEGGLPGGVDALYSIVQMPAGIPVACMAVGKAGARNAAILAARIIALTDKNTADKLLKFKENGFKLPF